MSTSIKKALELHKQGQVNEAERLYRSVLLSSPCDFDALHLLGVLKLQNGDPAEAVRLIGAAIEIDQRSVPAHLHQGLALAALNRHEEALDAFNEALAISPRNAAVLTSRGDALCDLGRPAEALESYDRAIGSDPRTVAALLNRGNLLRALGRPSEALASYEKAVAVDPRNAIALNNHGTALHDMDRVAEALTCYDRALALMPDYIEALFNRGNALLALRRPGDAVKAYARVLLLDSKHVAAYNNRGNAFARLRRHEEALNSYDQALAIDPQHLDALINRAAALGKVERYDEAIDAYLQLRTSQPEVATVLNDLLGYYTTICRWTDIAELAAEAIAGVAAGTVPIDPALLLRLDCTPEQHLAGAKNWLRLKGIKAVTRDWRKETFPTDKIRIAYLSADFHQHVTAYVLAELFELHDRSRFETIGISFGPDDASPVRARLVKSFDRFFDVQSRSDADAAALIRDNKVHIAVDLKGYTTDSRIGILAQRAAPVQASYMGFPASTGADFIDYIIADRIVLPLDQQPFYTEKIVHLPDSYYVADSKRPIAALPPTRGACGLPEDGFVFCCFNNSWKITARVFDVWMRLLKSVDGSVVWLLKSNAAAAANLLSAAQQRGVDPDRLVFAPQCDLPAHLARIALADLCLDTLPYNAHTTAMDALWLGVPIVTTMGEVFSARVAASQLHALGLPELITRNLEEYEALALTLATNRSQLETIRQKLAHHRSHYPLFNTGRFCRHLEAAYAAMYEAWRRGEAPQSRSVDPLPQGIV
jgi:predicted O-linked N-acetylglucosamine transferase (SPINDLY family)